MAIFSRRTLQRLIDENSRFLSASQIKSHIRRLNSKHLNDCLSAEWEIALLNAFGRLGAVQHEPNLGGRCRPDIKFTRSEDIKATFIADVATVSDVGLDAQNPAHALSQELSSLAHKYGLNGNRFSITIGSVKGNFYKLRLPGRSRFNEVIFTPTFHDFLKRLETNPMQPETYVLDTLDAAVTISYSPGQMHAYMSHAAYTAQRTDVRNPVYTTLEDKAVQLRDCGFSGPCAVVICDGGCTLLSSTSTQGIGNSVRRFLCQHREISFVLAITVRLNRKTYECSVSLYEGAEFASLATALKESIMRLKDSLPIAEASSINGRNYLNWAKSDKGRSFFGGYTMGGTEIQISSRTLIGLLSGEISQEEFLKAHGLDKHNFFKVLTTEGRMVSEISLRPEPERDDDWIVFRFGECDPAISRFRGPKRAI